jgi:hypothetical protein
MGPKVRCADHTLWHSKHWVMGVASGLSWRLLQNPPLKYGLPNIILGIYFCCLMVRRLGNPLWHCTRSLMSELPTVKSSCTPLIYHVRCTGESRSLWTQLSRLIFFCSLSFWSWIGHRSIMIHIFNGTAQSLHTAVRIVPHVNTTASFHVCSSSVLITCFAIWHYHVIHKLYTAWKAAPFCCFNFFQHLCCCWKLSCMGLPVTWSATVIALFISSADEPASLQEGLHSKQWIGSRHKRFVVYQNRSLSCCSTVAEQVVCKIAKKLGCL